MVSDKLRDRLDSEFDRGRIWTYVIFVLISIACFYKAYKFQYPNFIFTYPFISYDGYQWMSDGLYYLDRAIDITHRNPALPLSFAFLRVLGLVDYYPFIIAALTLSFYLAAYWLVRALASPSVSRLTVLWFFFVFKIHNFFDFILSDPWCLVLTTAGLGCLLRAGRQLKYLIGAAACFGLAINYQFAPAFMAPALIWFVCREIGWAKLKDNRSLAISSVLVFLALALPQFIYKWITFGTPLYSHVTQFPLLRVHLFGLPFYALNMFAFLGWPLACVMLYGAKRSFDTKDNGWQLIHLYALCMILFWVVSYLWLDPRFLLYLIPAWMAFAAKGIEDLHLLNWLSFKNKTAIHRAAIVLAVYFAVSLSSYKANAFEGNFLAITPQMGLRFSSVPMTEWAVTPLTTDHIATEYIDTDESLFNLAGHFKFYRRFARAPRAHSIEYIHDVLDAAKIVAQQTTSADQIGLCGDLGNVFETKMRIFYTLSRNMAECSHGKMSLARIKDLRELVPDHSQYHEIWRGTELVLFNE